MRAHRCDEQWTSCLAGMYMQATRVSRCNQGMIGCRLESDDGRADF